MPQVKFEKIRFLGGVVKANDVARLKLDPLPRIAFAGRSNVGKSSLLNALTGEKVARVSAEPGKTREMNFFYWSRSRDLKEQCILVDLPGYGYAKVPTSLRNQWGQEITNWLTKDPMIALVVALVDGRHGFLKNDVELVEFLRGSGLPFLVAFTKMDKWKSANQRKNGERELAKVSKELGVDQYVYVTVEEPTGTKPLEHVLKEVLLSS